MANELFAFDENEIALRLLSVGFNFLLRWHLAVGWARKAEFISLENVSFHYHFDVSNKLNRAAPKI